MNTCNLHVASILSNAVSDSLYSVKNPDMEVRVHHRAH